jgi:hypothetical protein
VDRQKADQLIAQQFQIFRDKSDSDLTKLIEKVPVNTKSLERAAKSIGSRLRFFGDSHRNWRILVLSSIDDGGFWEFSPFSSDFIKNKLDEFIGDWTKRVRD